METAAQAVAIPVGTVKSFGPYGPEYEVLGAAPRGKKGEMVTVRDIRALRVDQWSDFTASVKSKS